MKKRKENDPEYGKKFHGKGMKAGTCKNKFTGGLFLQPPAKSDKYFYKEKESKTHVLLS